MQKNNSFSVDMDKICDYVKIVINEKTGYPKEILEDELDLEADLGIDSVKQGEIFVKLMEKYKINTQKNIKELNTIKKVASFIASNFSTNEVEKEKIELDENLVIEENSYEKVHNYVVDMFSKKTEYPKEILEDELDLESELGIDSVKQGEIFVSIGDKFKLDINEVYNKKELNTIKNISKFIYEQICNASKVSEEPREEKLEKENYLEKEMIQDDVKKYIYQLISERTGYPKEILEDELDLEADLGIDSVKQGEIFGNLQLHFKLENKIVNIKEYNTISKIVKLVMMKSVEENQENVLLNTNKVNIGKEELIKNICDTYLSHRYICETVNSTFNENNKEKFDLENKNILLIADSKDGMLTRKLYKKLKDIGANVSVLAEKENDIDLSCEQTDMYNEIDIKQSMNKIINKEGKIDIIINCFSYGEKCEFENLDGDMWNHKIISTYNACFYPVKAIYEYFEQNKEKCAYFAITNIGGAFGYENTQNGFNSMGAVTSGFSKALEKELRPFQCKVIDMDCNNIDFIVDRVCKEFMIKEDVIEIAYLDEKTRKRTYLVCKELKKQTMKMDMLP